VFDGATSLDVFCDIRKGRDQLSTQWELFSGGKVLGVDQGNRGFFVSADAGVPSKWRRRRSEGLTRAPVSSVRTTR
jgi:hypothetical protein